MEWNRVGQSSPSFLAEIKTKTQAFPLYLICSVYKMLSIATMIALLRWYAVVPILVILISLEILACLILKTTERIKHYRQSQRFYIVFSLMTMALPGSLLNENRENKEWIRWESRVSSLIHSMVLLALTIIWENTYILHMSVCTGDFIKMNLPYIMIGIVILSFLHVFAIELYFHCLPNLCWLGLRNAAERYDMALGEYQKIKIKTVDNENPYDQFAGYRNENDLTICSPTEFSCLLSMVPLNEDDKEERIQAGNKNMILDGIVGRFSKHETVVERKKVVYTTTITVTILVRIINCA